MFTPRQYHTLETSSYVVRIKLETAIPSDADAISTLHTIAAQKLTEIHGNGPWSGETSEKWVLFVMRMAKVYVVRRRNEIVATLALGTKKPWAIDKKYFSKCKNPVYLTAMAVAPELQRQGVGRLCIQAAEKNIKQWSADAIRLDAYDAAAGAGEFYRKCGFCEVGRASYRGVPLIYFEMLI